MADSSPRRCGMASCGSSDGVRLFVVGPRCRSCTPSRAAGVPEPDVLLARHRARLAELADSDMHALNQGVPGRDRAAAA